MITSKATHQSFYYSCRDVKPKRNEVQNEETKKPKQSVTSLLFSNKIHTQNFCDSLSCQACDSGVFCHSMHSSLLLSVLSVLSDEHFPSFSQILLCRSSVEHIQHSSVFVAYFELKTPKSNSIFSLNFFIFRKESREIALGTKETL